MTAYQEGRLDEAIDGFSTARQAFLAIGDQGKAAEMGSNLSVALLQADRPQKALETVEGIPEIFLGLGDTSRAAQAYGNLASVLEACGDYESAESTYRKAIELFADLDDTECHRYTLQALSRLLLRRGQPLEAVAMMQVGLDSQPHLGIRDRIIRFLLRLPLRLLGR